MLQVIVIVLNVLVVLIIHKHILLGRSQAHAESALKDLRFSPCLLELCISFFQKLLVSIPLLFNFGELILKSASCNETIRLTFQVRETLFNAFTLLFGVCLCSLEAEFLEASPDPCN
jgi:hypothetical protein